MDLIAFLAILGTGVVLIRFGVAAESLATICIALGGLHTAWQASSTKRGRMRDETDE
ncbi:hypothetical protein ACN2WE_10275 [Streptomyces sp. cg28]|uniref:hypothetical protein n=1 Tax=Streptomyces sp. cg28 TaxID=3403457 RepID=UPI003B215A73